MKESKCLSCAKFWKNCNNENEKCSKGGSFGGKIDYCTDYKPLSDITPSAEENTGLYPKYTVIKNDTGKLVTDCFILKPKSDEVARKALLFYAENCGNEQLANDLKCWIESIEME